MNDQTDQPEAVMPPVACVSATGASTCTLRLRSGLAALRRAGIFWISFVCLLVMPSSFARQIQAQCQCNLMLCWLPFRETTL
jgi:hypothetical protein